MVAVVRKLFGLLIALVAVVAAVAAYLLLTTPSAGARARLPLSPEQRELLLSVPADAEAFAFIPTAAAVERRLERNAMTRDLVLQWRDQQPWLRPWMLGRADLVVSRRGRMTSYALRLDPLRALLVHTYLMFAGSSENFDTSSILINSSAPNPLSTATIEQLLTLADRSGEYDALVVQRDRSRGAFPPISRPSVTTVLVSQKEITLTSRAAAEERLLPVPAAMHPRFPAGALLSVAFSSPPRVLRDLDRLLGGTISDLGESGGMLALYDVNTGTMLPRPKGVLILEGAAARAAATSQAAQVAASVGEVRDTGRELLVSLDRTSIPLYLKDRFEPGTWSANVWAGRVDPQRLLPILEDAGESPALRIMASRVHRSSRELRKWIGPLSRASYIEAAVSTDGSREEMRARIVSK